MISRESRDGAPDNSDGPHGDPARWTPRLRRILDAQRELYEALDQLSERQSRLVASGETDELLAVLSERHQIVEKLWRSGDEFAPFQRRWAELMTALPPVRREEFTASALELASIIERIARRDEADSRELERRRSIVADELSSLNRGRAAVAAYGAPSGASSAAVRSRFQDREV